MISIDINLAEKLLRNNELVAIPTETVYGLAGNAFSQEAVAKIFTVKNRPTFDPLIVHSDSIEKIHTFVEHFPPKAVILAKHLWPGPLTLLLPKKQIIPDLVTAGLPTVGVRIPKHFLTLELLHRLEFPLAAPSANPFGYVSPTSAQHVADQLGDKIPLILDGGPCSVGVESTIIGFTEDTPIIYRLGGIPVEYLEKIIGKVEVKTHSSSNPLAPGNLESHYAPHKKVWLGSLDELLQSFLPQEIGVLAFCKKVPQIPCENQFILSPQQNLTEAAQNLFAMMRALDKMPVKIIWAELLPEQQLGRAINDRLRRASVKKLH